MVNGSESAQSPHILVSFQAAGRLYPYGVDGEPPSIGTSVVVQTDRGVSVGLVVGLKADEAQNNREPLPKIIRVATTEDLTQEDRNREREARATRICLQCIRHHRLNMKLVKVHYMLGGQKAVFYFTADGRVDFRALVKDLARELRIRVEMRQIGVRDETKMIGGVGHCGLELCCSTWLRDFVPVSIRMAKDQNLALNPQKVSGACGRLLCCLAYEHETYVDMRKELPKMGRRLHTTAGPGRVVAIEVLKQRFVVELDGGGRSLLTPEDIISHNAPPFGGESRSKKPQLATLKPKERAEATTDPPAPPQSPAEGEKPMADTPAEASAPTQSPAEGENPVADTPAKASAPRQSPAEGEKRVAPTEAAAPIEPPTPSETSSATAATDAREDDGARIDAPAEGDPSDGETPPSEQQD